MKTTEEVDHAIERMTLVRDGLLRGNMHAHAAIAEHVVEALRWMRGGESKFGEIMAHLDAAISAAVSHTN